jgi:hypothetical protein
MNPQGSSFIPKHQLGATPGGVKTRRTFSVLRIVATVVLLASVITAAGAYLYERQKIADKKELGVALVAKQETLSSLDVDALRYFDRRLRTATHLLDNHIAPTKVLSALEGKTLGKVQFNTFSFEHDPGLEAFLKLDGVTAEFITLAAQSQTFDEDAITSGLSVMALSSAASNPTATAPGTAGAQNNVGFSLETTIDLSTIRFDGTNPVSWNGVERGAVLGVATDGTPVESLADPAVVVNP